MSKKPIPEFVILTRSRVMTTPGFIGAEAQWGAMVGGEFQDKALAEKEAALLQARYPRAEFIVSPKGALG